MLQMLKCYTRQFQLAFATLAAAVCTGCVAPATFIDPVTNFQKASTIVITSARTEYTGANTVERNAVIDAYAAKRARILDRENLGDSSIIIRSDDLQARLTALEALTKHGELLLALAGSDAAAEAKKSTIQLGDSLIRLNKALDDTPNGDFKIRVTAYSGAAAEIVDAVVQQKISLALQKAIIASDSAVSALIAQMRTDMFLLYERRRSILGDKRKQEVDRFNAEVTAQNPSPERIDKAATSLKSATSAYADLPLLLGAGEGLDSMADAHQHLVAYAKSARSPQDFASMVNAVDAFTARASAIAGAVRSAKASSTE